MNTRLLTLLLAVCAVALPVRADFRMPSRVFRMSEFGEATAEAVEKNEPLAFVYTTESTSCPKCVHASEEAVDELKRSCVMVYVNSAAQQEFRSLPETAQNALLDPKAGRYIPRTVVLSPDLSEVLAIVPYAKGNEYENLLEEAEDAVREAMKPSKAGSAGATERRSLSIRPDKNRKPRKWTDAKGRTLTATLVKEELGEFHLRTEEGRTVRIELQRFSRADQQYILNLKRGGGQ